MEQPKVSRTLAWTDIAGYLPHKLNAISTRTTYVEPPSVGVVDYVDVKLNEISIVPHKGEAPYFLCSLAECIPYLRPMSDLINPCLEGGKVPLVELARIAAKSLAMYEDKDEAFWSELTAEKSAVGDWRLTHKKYCWFIAELDSYSLCYKLYDEVDEVVDTAPLPLIFDRLHEWHFDYRGLIAAGLALDVNTVNTNQ